MKYDAIVVASGIGKRADLGFNKVLFVMKNGKTVLENSCHLFIEDEDCGQVIVVTNEDIKFDNSKVKVISGGKERYNSVLNGLNEVKSDYVLIHDGARPFLSKSDLEKVKEAVFKYDGALLAIKATNTIKYVEDGFIKETINRENIYGAQTPQAFKVDLLRKAFSMIDLSGITDDASVFEKAGYPVRIVEGESYNIKLTNKEDFIGI